MDQQQFEQLVSDIAIKSVQTKPKQLEAAIDEMLQSIGQFFHTRRCFLGQFSKNFNQLHFTNIWVDKGMHLFSSQFEIDAAAEMPLEVQQDRNDDLIHFDTNSIEKASEEPFSQLLESHGITDAMVVPIIVEGKLLGLLGLDSFTRPCRHPVTMGNRLQIIADMIGSLLSRIQQRSQIMNK